MAFQLMTTRNTFKVGNGIIGSSDNQNNCSVSRNTNECFFYCNNPEQIVEASLADNGAWLAHELITGNGHLYTWHINTTSTVIYSDLLLYNPNSTPVTITISNVGQTNSAGGNDRKAWENYYNNTSGSQTYTLSPYEFKTILHQGPIAVNNVFGKIARFSISGGGLYLYELAYKNVSSSAQKPAPRDGSISRTRGLGNGFYETMSVKLTLTDAAATQAFTFGGLDAANKNKNDSFRGAELIYIKDSSASYGSSYNCSYDLYGNYGVQMRINLTIDNQCRVGNNGKRVRIFMGAAGRDGYAAFCRYNKQFFTADQGTIPYDKKAEKIEYIDVLFNDNMPFGETTVTFDVVVPAQNSAPTFIGARWV